MKNEQLSIDFSKKQRAPRPESAARRILRNFKKQQRLNYLLSYCSKKDRFIALNGVQMF